MLYSNIKRCVALEHSTCTRFQVNKGIRQGWKSSPLLFILTIYSCGGAIINYNKKNDNNGIDGIDILERQIIISQFADDTTLFLKK